MLPGGSDPADPSRALRPRGSELALRIGSALILAPLAIVITYLGGWSFLVFWGLAAILVLREWFNLVGAAGQAFPFATATLTLVLALAFLGLGRPAAVTIALLLGFIAVALVAGPQQRWWAAAGLIYAGAVGVAPVILRSDLHHGFLALLFVFAVVWGTDIAAYFAGRTLGGRKLMPAVSPKKTWSGAVGGTLAAVLVAVAFAPLSGGSGTVAIVTVAVALSVLSQIGDLFESSLKRRFNVKDTSQLIPGHGGLMDRLDGFLLAIAGAAIIGIARGGLEAPARGLLVW